MRMQIRTLLAGKVYIAALCACMCAEILISNMEDYHNIDHAPTHSIQSVGQFYSDCKLVSLIRDTVISHELVIESVRGLDLSPNLFFFLSFSFSSFFYERTNVCASDKSWGNLRSVATHSRASAPRSGVATLIDSLRPFGAIPSPRFLLARHVASLVCSICETSGPSVIKQSPREWETRHGRHARFFIFFHSP